ncbi:hypothetical protein GGI07_005920, partial [Coemansia sp. Benny D115]
DGVYNYALMTTQTLLHSADSSWFEPPPTDDIEIDATQTMPLPTEETYEGFFDDKFGDLNKKDLLS